MKAKKIDTIKEIIDSLKVQQGILKDLKKSSKELCNISNLSLDCFNEMKQFGEASYPNDIGSKELLARYKFFGTMLGLIDFKLDSIKASLKSDSNKEAEYSRVLNLRKEVLMDIKNLEQHFRQIDQEKDYESYNKLSLAILLDDCNFRYKEELVEIYNYAYNNSHKMDINNIYYNYRILCDEVLTNSKTNNQKKLERVLK